MTRIAAVCALVAAAAAALLLVVRDDPYTISVPVANASGLKDGSAVRIGGLDRGKVRLRIDAHDDVILDLELDDAAGKVGRDATVAIVAANFLGLKRVELNPGDAAGNPAPDGYMLPRTHVTTPTDLDQVLSVFDADTRTRAKILLNEAGEAVVGRKVDVGKLLREFPVGMREAGPALAELATGNATMRDLVTRSDRFVAEVTRQRKALSRLVDSVGQTAQTVSARRAELRVTLARAPGTLRTLRGLLGDLEATTHDLGPAARSITASAPALGDTLAAVDGFRRAAAPALAKAVDVAPALTRLATKATPVLRRARPAAQSAATLAQALPPVTDALDDSADNVIAILENWSRAIQFRDQLGHVFRGEASFSPDLILSMVERLTKPRRNERKRASRPAARPALPKPVDDAVKRLPDAVKRLPQLDGALKQLPTGQIQQLVDGLLDGGQRQDPGTLLDFLLSP